MPLRPLGLMLSVIMGLSACSSDPEHSKIVKNLFNRGEAVQFDPDFVALRNAGAPTYVAGLQSRKDAYTLFARQTTNAKGEETWISPDHLSLGMKDGLIIATRGFGNDIYAADVDDTLNALKAGHESAITEHFIAPLSGANQVEWLAFRCQVTRRSRQPVQLSETYAADTDLFYETCRNGQMNFRNVYWVERGSREIVQSRQWISEETGDLSLRLVP